MTDNPHNLVPASDPEPSIFGKLAAMTPEEREAMHAEYSAEALARPPHQFTAKFDGWCPECQGAIEAGEQVAYNADDRVVHVDCWTPSRPTPTTTTTTCPKCWTIKPCACDDEEGLPTKGDKLTTAPRPVAASPDRCPECRQRSPWHYADCSRS